MDDLKLVISQVDGDLAPARQALYDPEELEALQKIVAEINPDLELTRANLEKLFEKSENSENSTPFGNDKLTLSSAAASMPKTIVPGLPGTWRQIFPGESYKFSAKGGELVDATFSKEVVYEMRSLDGDARYLKALANGRKSPSENRVVDSDLPGFDVKLRTVGPGQNARIYGVIDAAGQVLKILFNKLVKQH